MVYSKEIKQQAYKLRRQGTSITQIAKRLGIVKSTISVWVSSIPLPKEIRDRLTDNSAKGLEMGHQIMKARRELVRLENIKESSKIIKAVFSRRNKEFWKICAALIFWCEGGKRTLSSGVRLTNSDPKLVIFFMHALRSGFELDEGRFSALIHLHEYHDEKTQIKFWSKVTNIPIHRFSKSYIKTHTKKRKRDNYPGCISMRYGDARLARKLDALYYMIAQYIERA